MSAKVYVLLDLVHADSAQLAQILRGKPGVAEIDVLEGPPSIIMVVEAPERLKAGEYLVDILDSVDGMTENLRVLPVRQSVGKSPVEIGHMVKT
jgi:hypothetical protein